MMSTDKNTMSAEFARIFDLVQQRELPCREKATYIKPTIAILFIQVVQRNGISSAAHEASLHFLAHDFQKRCGRIIPAYFPPFL
jgi:hypothetical protein